MQLTSPYRATYEKWLWKKTIKKYKTVQIRLKLKYKARHMFIVKVTRRSNNNKNLISLFIFIFIFEKNPQNGNPVPQSCFYIFRAVYHQLQGRTAFTSFRSAPNDWNDKAHKINHQSQDSPKQLILHLSCKDINTSVRLKLNA